jgi:hypothetical protein
MRPCGDSSDNVAHCSPISVRTSPGRLRRPRLSEMLIYSGVEFARHSKCDLSRVHARNALHHLGALSIIIHSRQRLTLYIVALHIPTPPPKSFPPLNRKTTILANKKPSRTFTHEIHANPTALPPVDPARQEVVQRVTVSVSWVLSSITPISSES